MTFGQMSYHETLHTLRLLRANAQRDFEYALRKRGSSEYRAEKLGLALGEIHACSVIADAAGYAHLYERYYDMYRKWWVRWQDELDAIRDEEITRMVQIVREVK